MYYLIVFNMKITTVTNLSLLQGVGRKILTTILNIRVSIHYLCTNVKMLSVRKMDIFHFQYSISRKPHDGTYEIKDGFHSRI